MKHCTIYHTGVFIYGESIMKDHKVFLRGKGEELYYPEELFMAIEECEGGLIQVEIDGKWGFADIYTGEIKIPPVWDYAGPFYHGYSHVALGANVELSKSGVDHCSILGYEGGRHGYIDQEGRVVIPLEYDSCNDICVNGEFFEVEKAGMRLLIGIQDRH